MEPVPAQVKAEVTVKAEVKTEYMGDEEAICSLAGLSLPEARTCRRGPQLGLPLAVRLGCQCHRCCRPGAGRRLAGWTGTATEHPHAHHADAAEGG